MAFLWRGAGVGRALIVVNTSYRMVPGADVLYAGDHAWFEHYGLDAQKKFKGEIWTGSQATAQSWPGVKLVRRVSGDQLPEDGICVGGMNGNSGLQAICFAALCGARRIALLGFDGGPREPSVTHWHEPHPSPLRPCYRSGDWPAMFETASKQLRDRGVAVTNCSRETRLYCFERGDIKQWTSS